MSFYKFKESDIRVSQIKAYPSCEFLIYNGNVYYNRQRKIIGKFAESTPIGGPGTISLYEMNVDRTSDDTGLVYPFVTKDGTLSAFKTVSTTSFNSDFGYGDVITGSYPLSASITRQFVTDSTRKHVKALKNTLNHYTNLSQYYQYSASFGNKDEDEISLISIPSIFYGSSIKKGTVSLKYYITGSLVAELTDINRNGELIQSGPVGSNGSGSVAGVVLYSEGFLLLSGSWAVEDDTTIQRDYIDDATDLKKSAWLFWGTGAGDGKSGTGSGVPNLSASYTLEFSGTNYVPSVTMLAHAKQGELNYSNNPTFYRSGQKRKLLPITSSVLYAQNSNILVKNTISSSFKGYEEPKFERQTFITKIGIYDEDKNLIAIANLATPVKKTEDRELTFKLKLDI